MRRARKRSITGLTIACALASAGDALAFHAGNVFDKPAGAGGGGGIFYVGSATERGWNCTACHTEPAGKIRVTLTSDPPSLLTTQLYVPGQTYALRATLDGEHRGAGASNFNSFVAAFVDATGAPAGELSGFAADELYAGRTTIASAGQKPGQTSWSFRWTAPKERVPGVKIHVAAVDGNGADGVGGGTLTDPWGDDVFVGTLPVAAATTGDGRAPGTAASIALISIAGALGLGRRRLGGRR